MKHGKSGHGGIGGARIEKALERTARQALAIEGGAAAIPEMLRPGGGASASIPVVKAPIDIGRIGKVEAPSDIGRIAQEARQIMEAFKPAPLRLESAEGVASRGLVQKQLEEKRLTAKGAQEAMQRGLMEKDPALVKKLMAEERLARLGAGTETLAAQRKEEKRLREKARRAEKRAAAIEAKRLAAQ